MSSAYLLAYSIGTLDSQSTVLIEKYDAVSRTPRSLPTGRLPYVPGGDGTANWAEVIRVQRAVLGGTDFIGVEDLARGGVMTYYVRLFIHLEGRKVEIGVITIHPNEQWLEQMARNVTMEG